MKQVPWKIYALFILVTEGVGFLSGWLTRDGAQAYSQSIIQPPLSPPAIVFPIVWGILFALMAIAAARIWLSPPSDLRTSTPYNRSLISSGASCSLISRPSGLPSFGWWCYGG